MIQNSKAKATTPSLRGPSVSPSRRRGNLFQPNGPFPWSWSSGLPTVLVPAPVWCCCLPASHSICPLHTHTLQLAWLQWLPGKVRWTRVGLSLASYLAPPSHSLAMRSEKSLRELPNGIHGDGASCCEALPFQGLGAEITAPAPAWPYPLAPPHKAHLPFKESEINPGAHQPSHPPDWLTLTA